MLRKENFINDQRRRSYLSATYNRINRGKSVLIEGDYGVGKSRFLTLLNSRKRQTIQVESLFNIHETLASILKKLNYDVKATYRRTPEYLERVCSLSNHVIIIDEANELRNHQLSGADHVVWLGRQHELWRYASYRATRRSRRTWHVWTFFTRESGDP